jgi:lipid-A-disaccharide synthase
MNPITAQILKRIIRVKYAHLANIMLDQEIVPEFIQNNCTVDNLSSTTLKLLNDVTARENQLSQFDAVRARIGGNKSPSQTAAEFLLSL